MNNATTTTKKISLTDKLNAILEKEAAQKSTAPVKKSRKVAEKNITRDHLTEYKSLIIWMMTKKVNFRGYLNLKKAMTKMLEVVNNGEATYKTERGLKGRICRLAAGCALEDIDENIREEQGLDILHTTETNRVYSAFEVHRLGVLQNL